MNDNNNDDLNKLLNELNDELNDVVENLIFMLQHNEIKDINLYNIYIEINDLLNNISIVENKILNNKLLNS